MPRIVSLAPWVILSALVGFSSISIGLEPIQYFQSPVSLPLGFIMFAFFGLAFLYDWDTLRREKIWLAFKRGDEVPDFTVSASDKTSRISGIISLSLSILLLVLWAWQNYSALLFGIGISFMFTRFLVSPYFLATRRKGGWEIIVALGLGLFIPMLVSYGTTGHYFPQGTLHLSIPLGLSFLGFLALRGARNQERDKLVGYTSIATVYGKKRAIKFGVFLIFMAGIISVLLWMPSPYFSGKMKIFAFIPLAVSLFGFARLSAMEKRKVHIAEIHKTYNSFALLHIISMLLIHHGVHWMIP